MKKASVGDVYAFKTERGYRIIHWAYKIDKQGSFVRIFREFYHTIPTNIENLVEHDCAYILNFDIAKMYRKGVLEHLGNYPISAQYPFPTYDIQYFQYSTHGEFEICEFSCHQHSETFISNHNGDGIPSKYKDVKLVNGIVDPIWFLCLLSSDFDMNHWNLFYSKDAWNEYERRYGDVIFGKGKTKT